MEVNSSRSALVVTLSCMLKAEGEMENYSKLHSDLMNNMLHSVLNQLQ